MITDVVMPKAGLTMVEGTIMEWKVDEGAQVSKGDVLMEYENEKNTIEMESLGGGLLHITAQVGDTIEVGARIGYLADTKEEYEKLLANPPADAPAPAETAADNTAQAAPAAPAPAAAPASAAASAPAAVPAQSVTAVQGGHVRATGLARKMAKDAGIDITLVPSDDGRIRAKDVTAYLQNPAPAPAAYAAPSASVEDVITEIPWIGVKKTIANNMMTSMQTTAQSTCMLEVDVTDLLALRKKLADNAEVLGYKPSVNDLLCRMLGKILVNHPKANATFDGNKLYTHSHVHLSVAVATDNGLMVPVVRNIDTLSLREIHDQVKVLAQQAKDKCLPMDAQSGGTCMVTNFGVFPMDFSTPILNAPQTCILGFGRTKLRPAVLEDGTIAPRQIMYVTFTLDHQVIDGLEVGNIFGEIEMYMKNPEMILA